LTKTQTHKVLQLLHNNNVEQNIFFSKKLSFSKKKILIIEIFGFFDGKLII